MNNKKKKSEILENLKICKASNELHMTYSIVYIWKRKLSVRKRQNGIKHRWNEEWKRVEKIEWIDESEKWP